MPLPSMIVLEGPDFARKSTLAAGLAAACGATIVTNGPPLATGSIRQHYADQIERATQGPVTVFDRLHIGELIYGPDLRGRSWLSEEDLERLEGQLAAVGAVRVHVDAPDAVLRHRLAGPRGDDLIHDPYRLLRIAGAYRQILTGRPAGLAGHRRHARHCPQRRTNSCDPPVDQGGPLPARAMVRVGPVRGPAITRSLSPVPPSRC